MKQLATFLLLCAATTLAAQAKLVGFVKRQSSGNEALPNAEVWCIGAKMTEARYSNSKGYFELEFSAKKHGAVVREISARLDGYEVVNKDALKSRVLAEHPEDDPLIIVLCRQGEYRRAAAEYYQTIYNAGEAQLLAEKKRLEDQLKREQQQNILLINQIADINAKLENLPQVAEAAADYLARIDRDQATEIQRKALLALKAGDILAALEAMPEEQMDQTMANAQKRKAQLESQLVETKQSIQQGIENYRFKARLYVSLGDYPSAERLYEKALAADKSNLENLYDFATFLEKIKRYEKALLWLDKVIHAPGADAWRIANAQGLKGQVYQEIGRFPEAEAAYNQCRDGYALLFKEEPGNDFYKKNLAISYSKLGDIYQAQGKFDTALVYFVKYSQFGEELYRYNFKSESLKNNLAVSYEKLGSIYQAQENFDTALVYFVKETNLFEELHRDNPKSESLKNGLAISYEKLGSIYQAQGKFDMALVYFVKDLKLMEELFRNNPKSERLKNSLATLYSKLGEIYQARGNFDTALGYFVKATDFFGELYRDNTKSERLKNGLATLYSKLGEIYQARGNFDTAMGYFLKQTNLFEELYRDNPKSADLLFGLGVSYYKLAALSEAMGKLEQALVYLQQALPLFQKLYGITGLEKHQQMGNVLEQKIRRL
jgi:tetratricopeptide (TPR) repeat protein